MSAGDAPFSAETLLSGTRGRALCWTLLWHLVSHEPVPAWSRVWEAGLTGDLSGHLGDLAACVALVDPVAAAPDEAALLKAFRWVVDTATYWQAPEPEGTALANHAVAEALLPLADMVAAAPTARWWSSPVDCSRQWYVRFLGDHPLPGLRLSGAAESLAGWRAAAAKHELSARDRPEDPSAPWSGHWWSTPALSGLLVTTRAVPDLGPVGLALVEDSLGWTSARCWPVAARDGARVFEVHGPDQWADLVTRYPLEVSLSRRHDWWRVTGRAGRWLIPDYAAVAADWDAVHVSVAGYLATAGIAVPVGRDAATMLAGWAPDGTWWLTDLLSLAGPPEDWAADDNAPFGWTSASET